MAVFVLCGLQGQLLAWQEAGALQPFAFEADGAGGEVFAEEIPEGFNGQEAVVINLAIKMATGAQAGVAVVGVSWIGGIQRFTEGNEGHEGKKSIFVIFVCFCSNKWP